MSLLSKLTQHRSLSLAARMLIVSVLLFYIGRVFFSGIEDIGNFSFQLDYSLMILSFFLLGMHYLIQAICWHLLSGFNRHSIGLLGNISSWYFSLLGKYIPGKVFAYLGRLYFYRNAESGLKQAVFSMAIELSIQLVALSILFSLTVSAQQFPGFSAYRTVSYPILVLAFLVLQPRVMEVIINKALAIFKREAIEVTLRYTQLVLLVILQTANLIILGVAFLLFIKSIYAYCCADYLTVIASFPIAGFVGMVAIIAPAGLGVREGVLLLMLSTVMPESVAAMISLASRLWVTAAEMMGVALAYSMHGRKTRLH